MRSILLLILLFGYLMVFGVSRPSGVEEKNGDRDTEEIEYENGGEEAIEDDTVQEDEESSAVRFSDNKAGQFNYPLDEKPDPNPDSEFQSSLVHRSMRTNENANYRLKNDVQDSDQDLIAMKHSDNKKMTASQDESNEEGELLFENNENRNGQMNTIDTNSYNNEQSDSNTQSSLYNKKQYSNMKIDHRETEGGKKYSGRDRREIEEFNRKDDLSNQNENLDNNEDEEAAIRKHVKKLSGVELEELLNSLSGDKRVLLKKIMENDPASNKDSISKREITKKAGAAEENIESVLLDSSKLQSGSEGTASPSSVGSSSDSSKSQDPQTEILTTKGFEIPNSSTEAANKADSTISDHQSLSSSAVLEESKIQVNTNSNSQVNTKAEIKREANIEDLANYEVENNFKDSEYLDSDQYMCVNDNNLSNEPQFYNKNGNLYKRDANSATDIKSLEESFPNSNKYDDSDPYAGSVMAPLIRVKRRNEDISVKKRAAALLPDAKVAFFPYRAESDDIDTEESNEFDDDGFYDRSSNLGKKNYSEKNMENIESPSRNLQSNKLQTNAVYQSKVESDTNNLGSDTDNVLSGVEGVDENLMLNSGLRNRRTIDDNLNMEEQPQDNSNKRLNRQFESTTLKGNDFNLPSENYMSVPNYQENDSFGPLPRNYESELNRYKRIRHVKQSPGVQETYLKT